MAMWFELDWQRSIGHLLSLMTSPINQAEKVCNPLQWFSVMRLSSVRSVNETFHVAVG